MSDVEKPFIYADSWTNLGLDVVSYIVYRVRRLFGDVDE